MDKRHYKVSVEVLDKDGKRIYDSKGEKAIRIQFEWESWSDSHMEYLMRDLHRTMKAWMPDNQVWIEAGIFHGDKGMQTLMNLYSYYGPEDRFVIHD